MGEKAKYTEKQRELDVFGHFDVVIVGGGCAGFSAAIAAARNKAKTLIIEQFPFFGGTATASLMASINGFRNQVDPSGLQTTKGIGEELILRLKEIDGLGHKAAYESLYDQSSYSITKNDLAYSYPIDTEKFKYMTLKMVHESGANILFHTYFTEVIKEDNKVTGIIIENKSGRQAVFGKVIIDATGDGDVAFKAGVPFWQTKHSEAHRLNDVLMYKVTDIPEKNNILGVECSKNMVLWGPNAGENDCTDAVELTKAEIKSRLAVYEDLEEKKKKDPQLKQARVIETGVLLGIRQTRFIEGLYKITAEDVLEGTQFEDNIAMAASPIIRYYGERRYVSHEGYGIPYRCILPKDVSNLLVAGRCMSSDQAAYESWRAMAHVMAIGEAAGIAAALSSHHDIEPKQLDVKLLQETLINQGAEIGQNLNTAYNTKR